MSVINRMLADLERRGAPPPQAGDHEMRAATPRRRRPRVSPRLWLSLLALVLLLLAGALWIQRGERIVASLRPAAEPKPAVAELVGVAFERDGERHRLELRLDGPLSRAPRYSRSGGGATLAVDAAGAGLVLPAPPPGQSVFRGISLDADESPRSRIRLDVAPEAEFELQVTDSRIALVGRLPASARAADTGTESPVTPETDSGNATEDIAAAPQAQAKEPDGPAATPVGEDTTAQGSATGGSETRLAADETADASVAPGEASPASVPTEPEPDAAGTGDDAGTVASGDRQADATDTAGDGTVRKSPSTSPQTQARRRYREGRDAIARGELATARRALAEALELDASLHAARELLVSLLRRAGETAAARRLLAEGVAQAPARLQFAMPYARMLVDTGDLEGAAGVLEAARASGAGSASYHALMAAVEQRRGAHRAAAGEYTRALEIRPGNGHWWLGLGISLAALDKPDEARAAFREARTSGTLSESLDRWARSRIEQLGMGNEG